MISATCTISVLRIDRKYKYMFMFPKAIRHIKGKHIHSWKCMVGIGCILSIVATDALVLKHQAISIHNADWIQSGAIIMLFNIFWYHIEHCNHSGSILTHSGLVTPYGDRDLGQHWALAQVIACCLTTPSHYLNQCWQIISEVQWHSY